MNKETAFLDLVQKYFIFLLTDYDFSVQQEYGEFGNYMQYQSSNLIVQVCKDRNSIFVLLKPVGEPNIAQLSLLNVVEAYSNVDTQYFPDIVSPNEYDHVLDYYAKSLNTHCAHLLQGDISNWTGFLEYSLTKMKNEYLNWTGKNLPKGTYKELEDYIKKKRSVK